MEPLTVGSKRVIAALYALSLLTFGTQSLLADPSDTVYAQSGGTASRSGLVLSAGSTDRSAVVVTNGGIFALTNSTVTTTGNTTSQDSSSFYGLNAGVLASGGSTVTLTGCTVTTTGTGANGIFSTGTGTTVILAGDTITCSGQGGHGVDATLSGTLALTDVVISTSEAHGAAIATDRGGGTITITRGSAAAAGQDSPGIYSTGSITAADAVIAATGAEAAVIEGANSITLSNTTLSGAKGTRDRCVMIYQSMSGDAQGTEGVFTMTGGSLTWPSTSGPVFYVTNSTGVITLKHVAISGSSPILVKAAADQWGTSGRNGGTVILTADSELLAGNLVCDAISAISLTLKNSSSLTGSVDSASLALDGGSTWTVTATSHVTAFSDPSGISGGMVANVTGNGHTVFYNAALAANTPLGGKTFQLLNGGSLAPESVSSVHSTEPGAPANFSLAQNYPNPCNPAAIIRYGLPARARVTLSVYNLLGQLIGTLVRETEDAGFHEAAFDGTGLPSGVYFYRLEAGGFVQAKRLILTR